MSEKSMNIVKSVGVGMALGAAAGMLLKPQKKTGKRIVSDAVKALGDVSPNDAALVGYQQQLKRLKSDLNDVTRAQNELVKGVKAADKLWKAAETGTMESLSVKEIKTGQRGMQARMQNLQPSKENADMLRAMKAAIEEGDIAIRKFEADTAHLLKTISEGGNVSSSALSKAKTDLQGLIDVLPNGTKEWNRYNQQLTTVSEKLREMTIEQQRATGKDTLGRAFRGDFVGADAKTLEQTITKLKEYQSVIADPSGKGARHFQATETAIKKLSEQLAKTKGDISSVEQALKVAGAASTANRFGAGLEEHGKRVSNSYKTTINTLKQLQQARANEDASIIRSEEKLAQYDTQIAAVTARQEKLRSELIRSGDANNLNTKQVAQSIQVLRQQQETVAVGSPAWQKYEAAIASLEERMKIMKGEAISLRDAMKLSGNAGGMGFTGSAEQLQLAEQALQKAAAAAKKGSPEWTRYQEALAKVRVEMQNAGMTSERMRSILDKSANAKNLNELQAAVKRAKAELDLMANTVGKNSKEYATLAGQTKNAEIQLKSLQSQSRGTASAFEKAWSRLKTYVGLYVGAAVAMQKLTSAMGDLLTLSDKMGEVRKTTGFTADEVGRLSGNLAKLDTRTTLTQLMELSSLAGSVGLKTQQDVQGFTEAADQLIVALPELGNESARTIIKIANATGDLEKNNNNVRETLEKVGSTIIALRANSASAAGPITDFVSRVGAVGAQAGISIDQIAALGSTIDALGGRVEMSATALSRMIPAIKNNSFAIANSIGVKESYLKSLAPMEQMVLIFQKMRDNIAGIDTSTEQGQEQMAATIEGMLGRNATMREVMKDLEQQGARAGIVFGLLSQNVDELQKQLGIASEAYRENTALANEFNNMNETTAAKLERLKNQVEEFFVGDQAQRFLGGIIDGLRKIVDLITEDGPIGSFFRWSLVYLALWKAKWAEAIGSALISLGKFIFSTEASTAATIEDTAAKTANTVATGAQAVATEAATVKTNMFAAAWGKLNKVQKANVIAALATAIVALGWKLWDAAQKAKAAAKQLDVLADVEKKAKEESVRQRAELERLYRVTQDQTNSMEERKKALREMVGDAKYKEYYENLTTESELASAAASAYKELAAEIIATARARALDAKAEELQSKRISLEDQRKEREEWEDENRGGYRQGRQEYQQRQRYAAGATSGVAGFQESQIVQRGAAEAKPAIIDEFEGSIRERNRIDSEIAQIDKDLARVEDQVKKMKPQGGAKDSGGSGGSGGGGGANPYGSYNRVTSPYQDWDADALVSRRKEMLERVRALANGADVQAVLSEDAKFITEATRKNIKTTRDAIEWYNTERLKIQDALHEKHLTNTGDWMDPKKGGRKASKMVQDDMKYYLDELDAYYTERKTRIQEAATEEGITEAEMKNRTLANEMEWYQRRAELQKLYAKKSAEVVQEEQDAIFDILSDRTGETTSYIQKDIESTVKFIEKVGKEKGRPAMDRILGDLDLGIERDYLKQQQAVTTQMKAIRDIIEKERPYDGITRNLRENLVTMGILTADITAERNRLMRENADMSDFNSRQAAEELKRTAFMLGEAEHAYSTTIEEVMRHMGEQGMQAWADAIRGDTQMQQALMAQLRTAYDEIQNAIKKEASLIKKQTDIWWADIAEGQTQSRRDGFEKALSRLGLAEDQVKRANSLIGAGQASERVADRLAIKQMQVRLAMQMTYYNRMRQIGEERIAQLKAEGRLEDAEHLRRSLNLAKTEELKKLEEQRVAIANQMEESENRLYTSLREWGELFSSSLQGVFEASNTGQADFYTEQAKKRLTGEGTSGSYIVVDHAGTASATASYQTLSDKEVLDIEQRNAMLDAWKKLMDDLNMKMSETITDQLNAMLQNESLDANTQAIIQNTEAIYAQMGQGEGAGVGTSHGSGFGTSGIGSVDPGLPPVVSDGDPESYERYAQWVQTYNAGQESMSQKNNETNTKMQKSTQSAFAKMTQAANLYGIAYQAMANDNMSAAQKFGMIAVQAAGQAAITSLTVSLSQQQGQAAADLPGVLGKIYKTLGPIGGSIAFAAFSGLLGGLMGLAASKIGKAKSEIAQATGASASAGRLATGMLTYAKGNVNEFTDPSSLTPGRQYNVDAADGKTYRARYMGKNPKTHLTNGPEFHLVGEAGREAIIDAKTTRQITMNDGEIWHAIQTLSGSGRINATRRRRGIRAFAEGNISEFSDYSDYSEYSDSPASPGFDSAALQASLDRNSAIQEALLERLNEPIVAQNILYGPDGLPNILRKLEKKAQRHGEQYL